MSYIGRTPTPAALTASDIADGIVSTAKIAADAVTNAKIADDVIGTEHFTSGTIEPSGDTAASDNAAIGYTSAEGLILTGQGSTSDVTIKNDADATVLSIATGTGIIHTPSQPMCWVAVGNTTDTVQTINATGTTEIVFDTERYDVGSNHDTATGYFTCPADGFYAVSASASITEVGSNYYKLQIDFGNANQQVHDFKHADEIDDTYDHGHMKGSGIGFCDANDVIKCSLYTNADSDWNVGEYSGYNTTFMSVFKVG